MSTRAAIALLVLTISLARDVVQAKRGCSAFGHSCYGGHGKRSGDTINTEGEGIMGTLEENRRDFGQEEVPIHTPYPGGRVLPASGDVIPIRDGGVYNHDENDVMKELSKFRLRNLIKHWMNTYRRENAEDLSLFQET